MEEAIQRFVDWFIKFAIVSAVLLISTHLLARSLRKKKKQKSEIPHSEAKSSKTSKIDNQPSQE